MTRLDKLIARIKARPPQADFGDVAAVLEAFGYERKRQEGSHVAFKKLGERTIIVPLVSGRKVNRVCLDQICELLGLDD
jgi:predicted RNA binding protein YcfA (HicA-like mRNA interferase family)